MSKKNILIIAGAMLLLLALASCAGPPGPQGPEGPQGPAGPAGPAGEAQGPAYAGSASCQECHEKTYDTFMMSGHPWKLNKVVDGKSPAYPFADKNGDLPLPEGYEWSDISYVIGGYNWKARFMDQNGYIITAPKGETPDAEVHKEYQNQWNYANDIVGKDAGWVLYNSGKTTKDQPGLVYDCGRCHTTGYFNYPAGEHQDDMPGIIGTWAEPGIQCEACHGPGSQHVENPKSFQLDVDTSSYLCGQCHDRGAQEFVDAQKGFIDHHEQYEELFQSKHISVECTVCHDPHTGVVQLREAGKQTTRTTCENCHFEQAQYRKSMDDVACIDCHMPFVGKSAWGNLDTFTGDVRTHLMAIDVTTFEQFYTVKEGDVEKTYALSQLGLNYACKSCHTGGLAIDDAALQAEAVDFHTPPAAP